MSKGTIHNQEQFLNHIALGVWAGKECKSFLIYDDVKHCSSMYYQYDKNLFV